MKRFFSIVLSFILLATLLLTGCSGTSDEPSVKETVSSNYDLLSDTLSDNSSFEAFAEVITNWAKENDIKLTSTNNKYLVLTKKGTDDAAGKESFTFHATIDFSNQKNTESSLSSAATVMTALNKAHSSEKTRGIFTLVEKGKVIGAEALNAEYLKCDNFIDISYSKKTALYNTIAASSDMCASKELNMTPSKYSKAYKLDLKLKEGQSAYKNRGAYPNAIKTIGDLLASCQSSSVLFELASFEGGTDTDMLPSEATATIVLHENDVESFTKRFDKSYDRVESDYEDLDDEEETFEYTMTEVDLPDVVVNKEDTEKIASLMYTMINGSYMKNDDGDVKAYSNLGVVSISNGKFELKLNAKSLENNLMEDMQADVKTICGLCSVQYKELNHTNLWYNPVSTPLVTALSDGMNKDLSGQLESKAASIYLAKSSSLNLIGWATEQKDIAGELKVILDYMAIAGTDSASEQ